MKPLTPFDLGLIALETLLLGTTLWITTASSVKGIIQAYKYQSYLLALITGLTAVKRLLEAKISPSLLVQFISLTLIVLLPLALGYFIEGLLARATIAQSERQWLPSPGEHQAAERIWLKRQGRVKPSSAIVVYGFLIVLAAWIALRAIPPSPQFQLPEQTGLMVSLSLHLIGLYNTVVKLDIVSQVIGLLTMDQGLFLAVVKIVALPVPALFFVVGLYFYTLITLVILVFLLPQVRQVTGSIDLDEIAAGSELEG